jgi:hypothetical protein
MNRERTTGTRSVLEASCVHPLADRYNPSYNGNGRHIERPAPEWRRPLARRDDAMIDDANELMPLIQPG